MDDTHLPHAHSHNSTFFGVLRTYANVQTTTGFLSGLKYVKDH